MDFFPEAFEKKEPCIQPKKGSQLWGVDEFLCSNQKRSEAKSNKSGESKHGVSTRKFTVLQRVLKESPPCRGWCRSC